MQIKNTKPSGRHHVRAAIAVVGLVACGFALGYICNDNCRATVGTVTDETPEKNWCDVGWSALEQRLQPADDPNPIAHIYNAILYDGAPCISYEERQELVQTELGMASMLTGGSFFSKHDEIYEIVARYAMNLDADLAEFKNRMKITENVIQ